MVRKFTAIFFLCICFFCYGQDSTLCIRQGADNEYYSYTSIQESQSLLKDKLEAARSRGFFAANIQQTSQHLDTVFYELEQGNKYSTLHIKEHNVINPEPWLEPERSLSLPEFNNWQENALTYYENRGFPFVNIQLSNFEIKQDTIFASLRLDPSVQITYDSIYVDGSSSLSTKYLGKYLNIELGADYRESDIKELDKKLRNLPLVKVNSPSRVVFYQKKARVMLFIDNVVTDRVDAIVGIAPNSANAEQNTLLLTGEVNIELNNLFKSAKQMELHWRNYLQRSQLLDVGFSWPYIANTKIGVSGNLNLNKYDTFFVNVTSKIAFQYQQQANNYFQIYYQNINSNLLNVDTTIIRSTKTIPANNPFKVDNYGIAAYQRDFDYLPNPRKGNELFVDVNIGSKSLLRNTLVDQVLFFDSASNQLQSIYDTITKKSLRATVNAEATFYIPIKKRSTLKQSITFKGVFSDDILFNEMYNFGGFSSLRGFDENEFFASKYLTYQLEYRYLIGENSNVGLFMNASAIENVLVSNDLIYETPIGFGAVANIKVGSGILNLAYALGSRQNNALQISTAKFHFGLINYF